MDAFNIQDVRLSTQQSEHDISSLLSSLPFLRLNELFCHFSFLNSPTERRMCVIPKKESLLNKLDGLTYPCIIYVKTSALFKFGVISMYN